MQNTVFVIDDDESIRESLTFLLRTNGMASRSFPAAQAFLNQFHADQRGCIITDVHMPGIDGMTFVRTLETIGCVMPVIVLTGHAHVGMAVEAMKAGVYDFIEKPFDVEEIVPTVRRCLELADTRQMQEAWRGQLLHRHASLTQREQQVFANVVEGRSNKEVAQALQISPRTVEIYRASVMAKMKADSLSELVRMALGLRGD